MRPFKITRVYDSYASRAARTAVILPLLHVVGTAKQAHKDLSDLRQCWSRRVLDLREAGWRALKTDKDANYMMNCPPFSVETDTRARPCQKALICPYCYARHHVLEPFRRAERVLYGCVGKPKTVPKPIRSDLRVFWFRAERRHLATGLARIFHQFGSKWNGAVAEGLV